MEESIQERLSRELKKLQEVDLEVVPDETIREMLTVFKHLDKDMSPVHDLLIYAIENMENPSTRTVLFYRFLKFYGIMGNPDILKTRQKYVLLKGTKVLQKVPFLKEKDKECINILLKEHDII